MKKKLLVDAHVFDYSYQGTRTFLKGLYSSLSNADLALEIYLAAENIDNLQEEFKHCDFKYLKYSSDNKYKRLAWDIPRLIEHNGIDLAHFQYVAPPVKNCKWIVTIHDLLFNDFACEFPLSYRLKNNFLFKRSARKADLVTTVSKYSAEAINRHYDIPIDDIVLTPNGVQSHFFDTYDKNLIKERVLQKFNLDKYVLFVSRIEPRKNHSLVLQVFDELNLADIGYQIVFSGKEAIRSKELENVIANISEKTKSAFVHLQNVNDLDLLDLYRAAALFVYPSKGEGFGIPPLEAGASSIPTLCSSATAMSDFSFFGDGLFKPENKDEFKMKIMQAISNSEVFFNTPEFIKENIRENYNWDSIAQNFGHEISKM